MQSLALEPAMTAPCHEAMAEGSSPGEPAAATTCDAAKAAGENVKNPILAVTDLPALPAAQPKVAALRVVSNTSRDVSAVCHSPPFTLLHCRLLN